jgi:enoyl-[acyl-carrier protein] reductase/trans-2-enoyl-CoA reductase (NAD+)
MKTPRVLNGVCLDVNPEGCMAAVRAWIAAEKATPALAAGPKSVLVLGASGGYGLAARVTAAFGCRAQTFGVSFERPPSTTRPATPGWYNNLAFDAAADQEGVLAETLVADAFLDATRQTVIERARACGFLPFDLVVYSLAAPLRADPLSGIVYRSAIKPLGQAFCGHTVDLMTGELSAVTVDPATPEECEATVKVMGGEDWLLWCRALHDARLLAQGATTVALSYVGPPLTQAIYRSGTLGKAKEHLEKTAFAIGPLLSDIQGRAFVSVHKALVTRASSVIPAMPPYLCALYKVMKSKGLQESCLEQMGRLFRTRLYAGGPVPVDEAGRIRLDELELREDVQAEVAAIMARLTTENVAQVADLAGCRQESLALYGFGDDE